MATTSLIRPQYPHITGLEQKSCLSGMRSCVRYYDQLGNYLGKRIHNGATKSILTREHLLMRSLNGKTQPLFSDPDDDDPAGSLLVAAWRADFSSQGW